MRFKGTVAYDGTDLEGWQSQTNGNTVQDILESRLAFLLEKPTRIFGSGRTDSGVHARGQVFHFDSEWSHPVEQLLRGFQSNVPETIQVSRIEEVPETFNARSSATGKRYMYHVYEGYASPFETRYCWSLGNRRKLDCEAMRAGAVSLLGRHDFTAFAGTHAKNLDPNPVKTLWRLEVERDGPRVRVITEGSGYMYKMVRSLVGALVHVGLGKLSANSIREILESRVRTARVITAPARGLFLDEVFYDETPFLK